MLTAQDLRKIGDVIAERVPKIVDDRIEAKVRPMLTTALAETEDRIMTAVKEGFDEMDVRFEKVEARLDRIEGRQDTVEATMVTKNDFERITANQEVRLTEKFDRRYIRLPETQRASSA
jgi:hypothetical protein